MLQEGSDKPGTQSASTVTFCSCVQPKSSMVPPLTPLLLIAPPASWCAVLCTNHQVTTYHISTLSTTQRAAAASSLLPDTRPSPSNTSASGADSRRSSGSSTATDQSQPDLLETYIVMELCPRGSLERALKQGRFRRRDGQPDMVSQIPVVLRQTRAQP